MMELPSVAASSLTQSVLEIAWSAGRQVMEIYSREDFGTTLKTNDSPLTLADIASHQLIVRELERLTPEWPVLTEESKAVDYGIRRSWKTFWLVDPLDGTKEFVKRNGEFTVNIALIQNKEPVLGVVYAPAEPVVYYAERGKGAFRIGPAGNSQGLHVNKDASGVLKVVSSRSHSGPDEEVFLNKVGPFEQVHVGSSLKLCRVAEGRAHLYPRFHPSMEWDTAAAQCVVTEAGGFVTDLSGRPLAYNKQELLNPSFIVSSLPASYWERFLS